MPCNSRAITLKLSTKKQLRHIVKGEIGLIINYRLIARDSVVNCPDLLSKMKEYSLGTPNVLVI